MPEQQVDFTTVGELADVLTVQSWRIARLFELGLLPEPPRLSGRRIIPRTQIPAVIAALRSRGWLRVDDGGEPCP